MSVIHILIVCCDIAFLPLPLYSLLGACIREPHPLAHLAHSDHAAASRSLASLRMATGCLLASTKDGVALVSANEASQAAELTKRLIQGSRSGRRALGMLGPRLAVPSSTAADASEARRIALEADGCASALALLCLNRSVSVASDAPGALGPLGPLLVDHAKEALAGVTAALEELAETTALVASDILRYAQLFSTALAPRRNFYCFGRKV